MLFKLNNKVRVSNHLLRLDKVGHKVGYEVILPALVLTIQRCQTVYPADRMLTPLEGDCHGNVAGFAIVTLSHDLSSFITVTC